MLRLLVFTVVLGLSAAAESDTSTYNSTQHAQDHLLTTDELNSLFSKYAGKYEKGFPDAAEIAFEAERRNVVWAKAVEEEVRTAAAQSSDISIDAGECRASICKYILAQGELASVMALEKQVVDTSKGGNYPVDVLRGFDSKSNKHLMYVFSLTAPADWVTELKLDK